MSEPLPDDELGRSFESRSTLSSDLGSLTQSVFVTGTPDGLSVEARVVPVGREHEESGSQAFEVRLEISGVRLGVRAARPGLAAIEVSQRLEEEGQEDVLAAFIPDHLGFDLTPQRLVDAHRRIPAVLDPEVRYNTTIFGDDDRRVFRDTPTRGRRSAVARPTSGRSAV